MQNTATQPTPSQIMQIGTGYWPSKILLSAIQFDLFTMLAGTTMNGLDIKKKLKLNCSDRHFFDFMDVLTGFGFLQREGIWDTAVYSNGPDTEIFLDKKKPSYIGGILEMMNNRLYGFWGNLEEGLRTGEPQNEAKRSEDFFGLIYSDEQKLRGFINAMTGIQTGNFMTFAQKFDFSRYKTMADIGGSAGILSVMVAKFNPNMKCTTCDLPQVQKIADETIEKFQLGDRVKTQNVDFFNDRFPAADVITMGNILHDWDEEKKIMLIQKAFDALPGGGAFVAIESVIDDERRKNVFGMMMSLNMLIETGTGFDYSFSDFQKWGHKAGFASTELIPLAGPSSACVAYK